MRRAIIHIGMPRTGSTSFQALLTTLRPGLAQAGILYPELAPPDAREGADVNHQPLGEALDGRRPRSERAPALARLSAALRATKADVAILSYEDFAVQKPSLRVPELLRDVCAAAGFAMETAMVVKPPFEQLRSAYAHRAQLVLERRSFREFGRDHWRSGRFDYAALSAPWRAASQGRFTAVPVRDARSPAPLLERILRALGLMERAGPMLDASDLRFVTNRSPGPLAVEASRRLRAMRVHRQHDGHPREIGHVLDDAAWSRGLDPEPLRGDAPEIRARMEMHFGATNEAFARAAWGASWESVVQDAPRRPPNELAGRPLDPEQEEAIALLVRETVAHFGFRAPPAWQVRAADLAEDLAERIARGTGYSRWRVI